MIDGHNVPAWLDALAWVFIILAVGSAVAIAVEILSGRKQKMAIMNLVWPVAALYFGPLAMWPYWRFGRSEIRRDQKGNPHKKPFWQTTFVGDSHCGAGCTIGDFVGEWVLILEQTGCDALKERLSGVARVCD